MMQTLVKSLLVLNLLLLTLISVTPVSAHTPVTDWYPAKWPDSDLIVNWKFTSNVPTNGALRARIKDGAQEWTNSSGSQMNFSFDSSGDYAPFSTSSCPSVSNPQKDGVHWGEMDNQFNTYGITYLCSYFDAGGVPHSQTTLHSFQIKFDHDENWNTDTGAPTGTEWDMWAGASHEFGHATGRLFTQSLGAPGGDGIGHFPNTWAVCTNTQADHHTMCKTNVMDKIWDRSLNTHDLDTFNDAY